MFYRDEPLPVLGVSPRDAPSCIFEINSEWAVYLIGLCEFMLWPDFWDAATGDVDQAIADAADLIGLLGECMLDEVAILTCQYASGVDGGSSLADDWAMRMLNTVKQSAGFLTFVPTGFTLSPGKYHIRARACGIGVGGTKLKMTTGVGGIGPFYGESGRARQSGGVYFPEWPELEFVVDIPQNNQFYLYQYTQNAVAVYGLGVSSDDGSPETYATVVIRSLSA